MAAVPAKIKKRIQDGIKRYKPILMKAESQDINESDTVTIVTDVLSDIFGYDKYSEITSEYAIKKTFCDLAIKIGDDVKLLIEVKAAGMNLKEQHLRQATDYGANSGIEWIVLTNGLDWKVYRIIFAQPIEHELVYEFNIPNLNTRNEGDLELLYLLSKEAVNKKNANALDEYHSQKQLLNGAMIGQILMSDDVLNVIRRVMKKVSSEAKVTNNEILEVMQNEVLKRDALEDERAPEYRRNVNKATAKPKVAKTEIK